MYIVFVTSWGVCTLAGAVYDIRKNYDDVFFVIGSIFVLASLIFGAIPIVKRHSDAAKSNAHLSDAPAAADERTSIVTGSDVHNNKQTFLLPAQSSMSKNSLNGDARLPATSQEYGTTDVTKANGTQGGLNGGVY